MIGTELVWQKIKQSGKAIIITTLTQSLRTFIIVSLVFGVVLKLMDLPLLFIGFITCLILKKQRKKKTSIVILLIAILITSGIGFLFNLVEQAFKPDYGQNKNLRTL